jgi:hypothetical protein
MEREKVISFLDIACRTLQELIHDRAFHEDLRTLAALGAAAPMIPPRPTPTFQAFLNRFMSFERTLLIQSKMNENVAADLLHDIRQIAELIHEVEVDIHALEQRLKDVAERTCSALRSETAALTRETQSRETWKVIKGCAIVAIDGGSAWAAHLIVPIIGGLVSAGPALLSIRIGSAMVSDVLRDRI